MCSLPYYNKQRTADNVVTLKNNYPIHKTHKLLPSRRSANGDRIVHSICSDCVTCLDHNSPALTYKTCFSTRWKHFNHFSGQIICGQVSSQNGKTRTHLRNGRCNKVWIHIAEVKPKQFIK